MKSGGLKKIEEIYHAAAEIRPGERELFLQKHCGADENLRREVQSLLAFENTSNNFLDNSPEALIAELFTEQDKKNDLIGKTIGHYKIHKLLGIGGMGEVYLAEDLNLGRPVALKCLPPEFVENTERMSRFVREAKTASALNHPNIITIYEINEFEGTHFIAIEFIDGKTLSEFTKGNPLSLDSALEIAVQIASALDEAHSAGIIHRDIKPDNVMVRPNGLVKVLDFGIAKLSGNGRVAAEPQTRGEKDENISADSAFHPSAASPETRSGTIIGTANYMSPEQAAGREIDARTDIFSFGVLVYEMLSGGLPFEGETPADVSGAIPNKKAKPSGADKIPAEIEKIIGQCLKKNRDERYQTIKEVLIDLREAKQDLLPERKTRHALVSTKEISPHTASRRSETANEMRPATKGIARRRSKVNKLPAIVFALIFISAAGFFGYRYFTAENQIRSIAVMPFVNESGNADLEYLSDGMTEMLINRLSNVPDLSVKARSTVFYYKGRKPSPNQIGGELNVDAVLFGHLIQTGDNLQLNLELVNTETQNILWAENYSRKLNDLVSVQSEIARDVSEKLRLKLTTAEEIIVSKVYTTNPEAHQLYLRGRFHWNKRNKKDFEKAAEYFQQAIEKDSNYALAYAGLADTYALMPLYGNFRPNEYKPLAKRSALKALELDADLAEAHASLGYIFNTYDFDWETAGREYKKAIELNPNYATAHQWYAEHLAFKGMTDEALEEISKALELDPFSVTINRMKGNILGFAGRYDEAISQLKKTEELYPENSLVKFNLGDAYASKKMYAEAVAQYLIALKLEGQPDEDLEKFKNAYQNNGWKGFWNAYLKKLLEHRNAVLETDKTAYLNSEEIAFAYAATGNREQALEYLERSFEERDPGLVTIKMSDVYDILSDDPRYKELIKNIGLPDSKIRE